MEFAQSNREAPQWWVDPAFAEAMADPLRVKIMGELGLRVMSAKQFADAFPECPRSKVYKAFRKLRKLGCIELVETRSGGRRRSAKEHFYRATQRAFFNKEIWANIPRSVREPATAVTLDHYFRRVSDAVEAGTMDKRTDRHVSWTALQLDQQGWDGLIGDFAEFLASSTGRQAESSARLVESGEEPISVTMGLSCFESPKPSPRDDR
jgi:hypothetical protein